MDPQRKMGFVESAGLEPVTSAVTGRSNQLSYAAVVSVLR